MKAGALATLAGALRPSAPALAAPGAMFELDLDGALDRRASADGWRTTRILRAPRRFDLIGLRWARGSRAEAQVRARRRGGRWTKWTTLHAAADHAPDGGAAPAGTDPAFVGAADLFQLRVRGRPGALRARFVRALPTAAVARRLRRRLWGRGARAAQAAGPPAIIPRAAWGADAVPPREPPLFGAVHLAFVHHTVTANEYGPEDSAAIVLGIARFHRDGNGWNDIGYNFLVDKYGQVFEGRAGGVDQPVVGAHTQGWNSFSTGVACLGDFTSVAQSPQGMDALARVIGWKLSLHGVPTQGPVTLTSIGGAANRYPAGTVVTFERISGHRDGNATSCPGDVLYTQLPALRIAAAGYAGPISGLTVFAPRRVRGLGATGVSGFLRFPDGSPSSGVVVGVQYQPKGSLAWTTLAGAVCGADATWRTTVSFPSSGLVRAVFAGDAARAPLQSATRRITVLARLKLSLSRRRLRAGRTFRVRGTASPATQVRLTLERRSRRRWVRERRRLLRVRDGAYQARLRPRSPGKYRVTVRVGSVVRHRTLYVL